MSRGLPPARSNTWCPDGPGSNANSTQPGQYVPGFFLSSGKLAVSCCQRPGTRPGTLPGTLPGTTVRTGAREGMAGCLRCGDPPSTTLADPSGRGIGAALPLAPTGPASAGRTSVACRLKLATAAASPWLRVRDSCARGRFPGVRPVHSLPRCRPYGDWRGRRCT